MADPKPPQPLLDAAAEAVLAREHAAAMQDEALLADVRSAIEAAKQAGQTIAEWTKLYPATVSLAVSSSIGEFLYVTALASSAKLIVEYGTSFGVSTVYLASAAKKTGGRVIGTELTPSKAERALANLEEAGLASVAEVRIGDAQNTLASIEGAIDLLFLDGWKHLYLPMLRLLEPKLRPGALVLADNIFSFPDELATYVDYVRDPIGRYRTSVIPFKTGVAYSLYAPS